MATATNPTPSPALHSLRNNTSNNNNTDTGVSGGVRGSPRRSPAAPGGSSPWTQIVRGGESSEPVIPATSNSPSPPPLSLSEQFVNSPDFAAPAPEDSAVEAAQLENSDDGCGGGNGNAAKKPVWNKPSNNGAAVEVSAVMGAVSWPALSESTTKGSPKLAPASASPDSLKVLSDGPVAVSQGTGIAFSSSQKQTNTNNPNINSTPNHAGPTRQRSMKRGGGNPSNNATANGVFPQLQPVPGPTVEMAPNNSGKSGDSGADSSSRDNNHRDGGHRGGFGSQSHGANEHHHQRNSYRRGNSGHPRGDGSHHHGYGSRRDQDRGNQDWNQHRSYGSRDAHGPSPRVPARPFFRGPPHAPPQFIPPPMPVRPFGSPIVYPEPSVIYVPGLPPDSLRMPMIAPMQPMFFHVPDPQLHSKILSQIEYYFSNENLIKDTFLRRNMDEQGWVHVNLIAGFKKVMQLTDNVQLILDAVRSSTVVEVQGEKIRRRNDWQKWIMPPSVQYSTVSSPHTPQKSTPDSLAEHLQSFAIDEKTKQGNPIAYLSRSSSAELSTSSKLSDNDIAERAGVQYRQPIPFNPSN